MLRSLAKLLLLIFLLSNISLAQISRVAGMGDLKFSIVDRDLSLSPYDFGGNPAWLFMDEQESYLKITPAYGNSWGNYRQKYDSEGNTNLGSAFHGIKTLGDLGTFSGFTSYNYENRRNNYRTLKKDTYNGEAFHFTDTTASDFRYMGPKVVLIYSWEPIEGLYAGGSVAYELMDGLKEKYSYAKTIYRNAELQAGLAVNFMHNAVFGVDVKYSDSQEAIEAQDVNLLDVEVRHYRGDNYYVGKRGSPITSKIKKQGFTFGSQLFWDDGEKLSIGLQSNYTPSDSRVLKPFTTTVSSMTTSFDEVEDSYAAFEFFDVQLKTQYKLDDDLTVGAYAGYFSDYSWSKISLKELLIWEWDIKKTVLGLGASYQASPSLLLGLEYEFSHSSVDSSKYIDNLLLNIVSNDHVLRTGAEYKLTDEVFLRCGFNYGAKEHDLIYGGKDCNSYKYSAGIGFPLFDLLTIDASLQYINVSPKKPDNFSRSYLSGNISLTVQAF
ncbi:MAG: hypothetical protein A2499_02580 [Stygiobacter sp. RIFOXYC12_FULL_38_8]|nr:MAG: hypothetical protein A2X62_11235 [Stygiobacter sp. GWC2_38_9]OGV06958.1 MAG: hypothetical protein A2299_16485 [Stygiobacter sp. RIFOXYB2_FULL_37_11]OGV15915.1 MAG: hypothetical protein A2440_02990 [Stygiobacter sp. RIFOXYC2_FULL_38_25]OGV26553.1 MAG: hypothetical protein A2499_02580 [Stygiobacter sp. RIFOXYC12_FULL_38_8]OGV80392.1 MAG: hypothetical protein A2X65_04150 [Stygiobacter sp. GWF2_38_21]